MKEITVNQPKFVAEFSCVGAACVEHCCQGWQIVFDKDTVSKYRKSPDMEIRTIAAESVQVLKKSHAVWARVKLENGKACNFMDENKLCKVHASMGPSALSQTCATYPRSSVSYKAELNHSLSLSCPEAARLLLTTDDAMQMITSVQLQAKANRIREVNQHDRLLNLMAMHLINTSQAAPEQGLFAIASLLLLAENQPQQTERLEAYFLSLMEDISRGNIAQQIVSKPALRQLPWALLTLMQSYLATLQPTRSLPRLKGYVADLMRLLKLDSEEYHIEESMERLDQAWTSLAEPWLQARPHIMRNYLLYRLYNDQFPDSRERQPMSWLYLLTAEWYLIKSLIAASADKQGELNEETVIGIIYSFHSATKHSMEATKVFLRQIESVKMKDDLSLLYLLK